jgi:hypothetical protein
VSVLGAQTNDTTDTHSSRTRHDPVRNFPLACLQGSRGTPWGSLDARPGTNAALQGERAPR